MNMNKIAIAGLIVSLGLLSTSISTAARDADSSIDRMQIERRENGLFYEIGANEPFTGSASRRLLNGQQVGKETYVDGRMTGETKRYKSGQMMLEAKCDMRGCTDRLVTEWFEDGQLKSRLTYVNSRPVEGTIWDKVGDSRTFRPEVEGALNVLHTHRQMVVEDYMDYGDFPLSINALSYGSPGGRDRYGYEHDVLINAGVITITIDSDAGEEFAGKTLLATPTALVDGISFQCSSPDIAAEFLPKECSSGTSVIAARGPVGPFVASDVVKFNLIEERENGLWYVIGANEPITGTVKGTFHGPGPRRYITETYVDGATTVMTWWFGNGQRFIERKYDSSQEVRYLTEWYENGQMRSEGAFKEGLPDGLVTEWFEDGQLKSQLTYVNGQLQ
jgi:antitoxin component YwqK of YwqJK toxin-antitoxin module